MNRIVITGMGIVSALGIGKAAFWEKCRLARSGIKSIESDLDGDHRCTVAALVEDYNPRRYLKPAVYRRMSRLSRMTASACIEAVHDCGLDLERADKDRIAIVAGTAHGSSESIEAFYASMLAEGPRGAQPFYFPETVPNAPAGHVAMILGITGPNTTFGQNDISAENALGFAHQLLVEDRADAAIVCGMDEIGDMLFGCYDALGALNRGSAKTDLSQPIMGAGMVLGEGAGALVLEQEAFARARRAEILATLASVAITGGLAAPGTYEKCDAALEKAINMALEQAGMGASDVDQISVSGNFTGHAERAEIAALSRCGLFDGRSKGVSPIRYLTGTFGGAGIFSAAALTLSLYRQQPLPFLNIQAYKATNTMPDWQLAEGGPARTALMTTCSYGGGCAALVFGH
jgi:3-oxoacyl-[acyl-carrier-protein] synthase II